MSNNKTTFGISRVGETGTRVAAARWTRIAMIIVTIWAILEREENKRTYWRRSLTSNRSARSCSTKTKCTKQRATYFWIVRTMNHPTTRRGARQLCEIQHTRGKHQEAHPWIKQGYRAECLLIPSRSSILRKLSIKPSKHRACWVIMKTLSQVAIFNHRSNRYWTYRISKRLRCLAIPAMMMDHIDNPGG